MQKIQIIPAGMALSPAYSHAIEVKDVQSTIYIGGQNAIDEQGNNIALNDFAGQCEKSLENFKTVLEACECTIENVVKWTISIVEGNDPLIGFAAYQKVFGKQEVPPTITILTVSMLSNPAHLVEIDGIAVK